MNLVAGSFFARYWSSSDSLCQSVSHHEGRYCLSRLAAIAIMVLITAALFATAMLLAAGVRSRRSGGCQ